MFFVRFFGGFERRGSTISNFSLAATNSEFAKRIQMYFMINDEINQKEMAWSVLTHPRPQNYTDHRLLPMETLDSTDKTLARRADRAHGPTTIDRGEPLLIGRAHVSEGGERRMAYRERFIGTLSGF